MANIKQAFEYAAQNPNSEFATNLKQLAASGSLNKEAEKYGIDLSAFQPKQTFMDKVGVEASRINTEFRKNKTEAEIRQARGEQTGLETLGQTFGEAAKAAAGTIVSPLTVGVGEVLKATGISKLTEEKAKATEAYIAEQKALNPNYDPATDQKLNPFTAGQVQAARDMGIPEYTPSEREKANLGIATNIGGAAIDVAGALEGATALKALAGSTARGVATGVKSTVNASKNLPSTISNATKAIQDIGKTPKTLERAVGEIAQGTTDTINPVKTALSVIDTTKVNTYADLLGEIKRAIPSVAQKVDNEFLKDSTVYSLNDLAVKQTTKAGKEVATDYVTKGLKELDDFYTSVGDDVAKADIQDLITKSTTEGLTKKEVNDIARLHGRELSAYNVNGQLASGLTKQAAENTRQGLKNTARQGLSEEAKNLDSQISALYDTQTLIEKNVEKVNRLKQLIQDRGLVEKIGYNFSKYADILTGGSIRGLVGGILPRGVGNKVMNALDLEDNLRANLDIVEKTLKSKTEKELIGNLNQLKSSVDDSARTTSSLNKNTTATTKKNINANIIADNIPQSTKAATKKVEKSIPKELQPLAEEARKYKSAEEFSSYGTNINGSDVYKYDHDLGEWKSLVKDGTKVMPEIPDTIQIYHRTNGQIPLGGFEIQKYNKKTMDRNFGDYIYASGDATENIEYGPNIIGFYLPKNKIGKWAEEVDASNSEWIIKDIGALQKYNKSQLTDIWNKANGKN